MALDKGLVANLNLKANGDQLLAPLQAYGREINKLARQLQNMLDGFTTGVHKQDNEARKMVQTMQRMIGEASTLQNLLTGAGNKRKNTLLEGLDEQAMGKKVLAASKLKRALEDATKPADALEIRLAQLNKHFNALGDAGRRVGQRDIAKAMNLDEAIRKARQYEKELAKIDARQKLSGKPLTGEALAARNNITAAQDRFLNRIQTGNRVNYTKELVQMEQLITAYMRLTKEETASAVAADRAAAARQRLLNQQLGASEPMLRAQINSRASKYKYSEDQARGFNITALNSQIDQGTQRLLNYQRALERATNNPKRSQESVDRLSRSFENLKTRLAEATAQKKAFDALPESRMQALNKALFGDGGIEFGKRIAGASLITTGVFAVINAAKEGVRQIVQLEDAFARLQAISGSTNAEMEKMAAGILELGKNSRYSVLEITESATAIAQAGFSAQETVNVLQASMQLAAASGSTPAEAIDTMTGALGAFQLQAEQSGHTADILVGGLNRSKLSIQQMQAALQYAGATAKETGMTFDELVATSASLANAGIRSGSTIGTGTRQLLVDLQTPTEKFRKEVADLGLTMADVDVRAKGLAGVVRTLNEAGFSGAAAFESFEARAAAAYLALANQSDGYDQLAQSIMQSGAAAAAAEKGQASLTARFTQLLNTLTSVISKLSGPFMDVLKGSVMLLNGVFTAVDGLVSIFGELVGGSNEVEKAVNSAFVGALAGFFFGPYGAVIGALAGLIGGLSNTSEELDKVQAATNDAAAAFEASESKVNSVEEAITTLITRQTELKNNSDALTTETQSLVGQFEGLATQLDGTAESYDQLLSAMLRYRGEALEQARLTAEDTKLKAENEIATTRGELSSSASLISAKVRFLPPNERDAAKRAADIVSRGDYTRAGSNQLQGALNDFRKAVGPNPTGPTKEFIEKLDSHLAMVQMILQATVRVDSANKAIKLAEVRQSDKGQARYRGQVAVQSGITLGLQMNEAKPGSGTALITNVLGSADEMERKQRAQLAKLDPNSAEAKDIRAFLSALAGYRGQATRADRISRENTDKANLTSIDGATVAASVRAKFPGANVYSYGKRSLAEQQRLYDNYKAGKGPLAAKPGKSNHGSGQAFDMTPIPGVTLDEVVTYLEAKGLEITEALNERNPETGKYHWHIAWNRKKSKFQAAQERDQATAARHLQDMIEARTGYRVQTAEENISTFITKAKDGKVPLDGGEDYLKQLTSEYRAAELERFDVSNPTAGLSKTQLTARAEARAQLEKKIQAKIEGDFADYAKAIGDVAIDIFDRAMKAADEAMEAANQAADQKLAQIENNAAVMNNDINRYTYGAGGAYLQEQRVKAAKVTNLTEKSSNVDARMTANRAATDELYKARLAIKPGTDDYNKITDKILASDAEYNKLLAERAELLRQINAETQAGAEGMGTLRDRLEASAQSWLSSSGAMDTWGKRLENSIGPALDTMTQGFTDFFTSIVTGSKSFGAALGDMAKMFANFVIQMVMQALALEAVKGILSLFGISPPGAFKGGPVDAGGDRTITVTHGKFNGGPIGLYSGGSTYPGLAGGGSVTRGVSTRDSALYNLARGEYVVRNKSVRELGLPFMDTINKHGKDGLNKMAGAGSMFANIQAPRQETNVYVVADKKAAGMSPNDVLITVHEDILQNGATKRLIRQVAQGG